MPSIQFTGLASGMDTASWVDALVKIKKEAVTTLENKQKNFTESQKAVSTIQSSFSSLRTAIEKLTDSKYGGSFDVFAKTKTSSTDADIVSATSTSSAKKASYSLSVSQLASATTASSSDGALAIKGSDVFSSTKNGGTGTFSVYVNGEKTSLTVGKDDTVDSVLAQINGISGVNASMKDGKVSITGDAGNSVVIGSSTDSVNVSKAFSLSKGTDGNYSSFEVLSNSSSTSKVADVLGASAMGTFKIGAAEFTIDENTTFASLTKAINENKDAGVNATFDSKKGQMVLTASNNGSFNINIEKGTSKFTDLMGYTSTDSVTGASKLATQELGQFAVFSINGESKMSSSNTVTSDLSGIEGVTFNLKGVSTTAKPSSTVAVSQDSADLLTAVKGFVEQFNSVISKVDTETASDGNLYGETNLLSIRNNLRTTATAKDAGSDTYKILASIGITTGKTSTDVSKVSDKLELDETKFLAALEENPDAVKELLIGGKNNTGVLTKLKTTVDQSLQSTGYFTTKNNSIDKQVTSLTTKITSENLRISEYKARLEKQFTQMETLIAKMQKSFGSFSAVSSGQ